MNALPHTRDEKELGRRKCSRCVRDYPRRADWHNLDHSVKAQ